MKSGIINIYKEKGYTSFDVVAKMRGILKEKKIGHTGTLDPDAEGVLPVCIGKATKLCDLLTDKDKEYETVLLLGKTTDTQDITGQVLSETEAAVTEDEVRSVVMSFVGGYDQLPPMYSALKVNGQKLCDLARKGMEVERKPRHVELFSIEILKITLPRVRMRVHCSKGTYIRTLCRDIGERLSCGGCMESLLRTRVERFELKDAVRLGELERLVSEGMAESVLLPVDRMFSELPARTVLPAFRKLSDNGNALRESHLCASPDAGRTERVRIYDDSGRFVGIYEFRKDQKLYKPIKIFLE
ncbi:MAG: tRNA pseudouridine(55) synthase TruB [Lachnospiraceae bacterium]|nr:tRNA pseudouridine(55) synthase TruB [Lachnospiraceae bacterium]